MLLVLIAILLDGRVFVLETVVCQFSCLKMLCHCQPDAFELAAE
jgi:hypothetical protein